ncbi:MAG TPA: DUF192 domain-containing protein [Phycisphaerales bacterium]|jgi:uncharacterized membrane protein (UPF0127 family)|nr:DUF192 domain-containing protein [Phycisphaerales bacterium]
MASVAGKALKGRAMWAVWAMMLMLHSTLHGCDSPAPPAIKGNIADVIISGKTYHLEIAADPAVRMKGLGGRTEIADDGGMIFVFAPSEVRVMGFVMRDCPIDIDILYLDGAGRVLTTYEMKAEAARGKDEGVAGDSDLNELERKLRASPNDEALRARIQGDETYEGRLKQYSSRFASTFVIELKAGSIKKLGVKEGDVVAFDRDGLKKLVR